MPLLARYKVLIMVARCDEGLKLSFFESLRAKSVFCVSMGG